MKFGTEEDITELKKRGKPGDYIIYHKEDDTTHPMRIAFLKIGGKRVVQKLRVEKSSKGFSFQSSNPTWYSSMSNLAKNTTDENSERLLNPFLGKVSPPATQGATSETNDENTDEEDGKYVGVVPPQPIKPINNEPKASSRKPLTPIPSVDSNTSEGASNDDPFKEEAKINTDPSNVDLLGNKAPTNLGIRYNLDKREIQKLLRGHPEGTYVIHQSRDKNEITKPYTIYANKTSATDGQVRLAPGYIVYNETTEQFSVGQAGKKYSTLEALVTGNKKMLRSQLT